MKTVARRSCALAGAAAVIVCLGAAPARAQLGTGWVQYSPTKRIHLDDDAGLQTFEWSSYRSVCSPICADYRYDAGTDTEIFRVIDARSNRSEIRLNNDYTTGRRQFEGYLKFFPPDNDPGVFQLWGSTTGATIMIMRVWAENGGTIRAMGSVSGVVATQAYGVEHRINVIHDQNNYVRVYDNGSLKVSAAENEDHFVYHKYGAYGNNARAGNVLVHWRRARSFRDGNPPGSTPVSTPTPTPTPTRTPTPTPSPTPSPTGPPSGGFVEITPGAGAVTASGNDGNLPGNTVDNNLGTRWSASGDGQWIQFDLGSVRTVAHVALAVYNGNSRQNRFDLQVSSDSVNWTTVIAGGLTSGTTTSEQVHDFADTLARWVRYVGHGATTSTFNSLTEVSLFAPSASSTPAPTPTPTATPGTPGTPVEVTPGASGVTASTSDTNLPANTVDNSLATRWSGNGDGAWIQYDLGATRTVTHVNVAVYNGNSRRNSFDLQVSTGGGVWTTVWSGQTSGTTTAEQAYDFPDTAARWVRYVGHGSDVNTFNSVTEVSVFAVP